jgi:hypothetical protein
MTKRKRFTEEFKREAVRLLETSQKQPSDLAPLQQRLMAPQPSSLRTSFRALFITRIEVKESRIYTAKGDTRSSNTKVGIRLGLN